jgi:hypothetical protein
MVWVGTWAGEVGRSSINSVSYGTATSVIEFGSWQNFCLNTGFVYVEFVGFKPRVLTVAVSVTARLQNHFVLLL